MEETVQGACCNNSRQVFVEEFDYAVQENQIMSEKVIPVQVHPGQSCYQGVALVEEEIGMSCDSLLPLSLTGKKPNALNKCATFPCSETVQYSFYTDEDSSPISVQLGQYSPATKLADNATYERSLSLPASFKLVSAMKGSSGQNETPSRDKLKVKWAPEVYDPPTSSMSHTVKVYNQRPKTKKKENRRKQNRGKPSGHNGTAKKLATEITSGSQSNDAAAPAVEISGYVVSAKDNNSKCGSCYMKASLTKMQIPMGAAS